MSIIETENAIRDLAGNYAASEKLTVPVGWSETVEIVKKAFFAGYKTAKCVSSECEYVTCQRFPSPHCKDCNKKMFVDMEKFID